MKLISRISRLALSALALFAIAGCDTADHVATGTTTAAAKSRTLTLGAYTTPREVYGKEILPAFQKHWKTKTGEDVTFQESYLGSGAQSRAIVSGFEADIAALSLEADIDRIEKAGLIKHDWKAASGGMVSRSVVVIAVRTGNPKNIQDWDDLARTGIDVLTPNVKTSGGAMWNISAIYGAAMRGHTSATRGDATAAEQFLRGILTNVTIMDKGARESMVTFEKGVGDAAITYENEVLVGRKSGQQYDYVVPTSTILIENPIALIDTYVDKHGNRDVAEEFLRFVRAADAQRAFVAYGLRSIDEAVAKETAANFPAVTDRFTIVDLGGWPEVNKTLFADGALYARALPAGEARK